MTTYAWPEAWGVNRFQMKVQPNQQAFPSLFSPSTVQVVDLGGDHWVASFTIPSSISKAYGAQLEAFINRLRGRQNSVSLFHMRRPTPRGTLGAGSAATWSTSTPATAIWSTSTPATATWTAGTPALRYALAQFATTGTISTLPGRTMLAGDLFGLANGQTVMQLVDTVADANGDMPIEFAPAARSEVAAFSYVTYDRPTVNFRLRDGDVPPVVWRPGMFEGISLDLVEAT